MPDFDVAAYVNRSRQGPCFVCAYLAGHSEYKHEHIFIDDDVVAFLSRYPTLLGYTIVAPRTHIVDVTGNRKLFRHVVDVVHDVAEALKATLPIERIYLMSYCFHSYLNRFESLESLEFSAFFCGALDRNMIRFAI
jgi:hypothetical protein